LFLASLASLLIPGMPAETYIFTAEFVIVYVELEFVIDFYFIALLVLVL